MIHAMILLFASTAAPDTQYTAVIHDRLAAELGMTFTASGLSPEGILYLAQPAGASMQWSISIGVHRSITDATNAALARSLTRSSSDPQAATQPQTDIGDARESWGNSVLFRRGNVVIDLIGIRKTREECRDLARRIDRLICDTREIAPIGELAPWPEIVNFPSKVYRSATLPGPVVTEPSQKTILIAPEFPGLGPPADVHFSVQSVEENAPYLEAVPDDTHQSSRVGGTREDDGRFRLVIPGSATGRKKITLVAANRDNVVVARSAELELLFPRELYTGVDQNRLAKALGWTLEIRSLEREGLVCKVGPPETGVENFVLGVFPCEDVARETVAFLRQIRPVPPSEPPPDGSPGSEFVWWTGSGRASVILRRDNLVIAYSKADASAALALARRIDELLRNDRQIAPRGVAEEFPEITALGIPESLTTSNRRTRTTTQPSDALSSARIPIAPSFLGLGDAASLRIRIIEDGRHDTLNETTQDGRSQDRIVVTNADGRRTSRPRRADEDGRFQFNVPLRAGPTVLRMIVATPSNMIVTRTTAVTISESP